jgi:hypothetical protein
LDSVIQTREATSRLVFFFGIFALTKILHETTPKFGFNLSWDQPSDK